MLESELPKDFWFTALQPIFVFAQEILHLKSRRGVSAGTVLVTRAELSWLHINLEAGFMIQLKFEYLHISNLFVGKFWASHCAFFEELDTETAGECTQNRCFCVSE